VAPPADPPPPPPPAPAQQAVQQAAQQQAMGPAQAPANGNFVFNISNGQMTYPLPGGGTNTVGTFNQGFLYVLADQIKQVTDMYATDIPSDLRDLLIGGYERGDDDLKESLDTGNMGLAAIGKGLAGRESDYWDNGNMTMPGSTGNMTKVVSRLESFDQKLGLVNQKFAAYKASGAMSPAVADYVQGLIQTYSNMIGGIASKYDEPTMTIRDSNRHRVTMEAKNFVHNLTIAPEGAAIPLPEAPQQTRQQAQNIHNQGTQVP
jgi:hypothetical protein